VVFVFASTNVLYYFYRFVYVEAPLHCGMKPTWSCLLIFLMCCWTQFAIILLRISTSMLIKGMGLIFSFLEVSLILG
jgi:hypothetical protein